MDLWIALIAGLAGSAHCATMCGAISATLGMGAKAPIGYVFAYNTARIVSYCMIALIFSTLLSAVIPSVPQLLFILRVVAGLMMILMGLFLLGKSSGLSGLEKVGAYIWRYLAPLASKFMPVDSFNKAFGLGLVWGWLPCGLVYSMLAIAVAQGSVVTSVTTMAAFGIGTLPAMYVIGLLGARFNEWVTKKSIRYFLAYCVIVLGVYTVFMSVMHLAGDHKHHTQQDEITVGHDKHQHH